MPHKGIQKYIYEEKICKQIVKSIFWTLTPFLCFSLGVTTLDYIFHPKWRQLSNSPRMDPTFRKTKFKNNFSFPFLNPLKFFFKILFTLFPGTTYTFFNKKWRKLSTTSPVGPENQFIRRNILEKL